MDEHYCPVCGEHHGHTETETAAEVIAVEESLRADVEIEKIRADKEIKLARIQAGLIENEVAVEAAIDAAHAEGEAAGLREAIAPPPPPEPVVIDAPEAVADDEPGDAPPETEGSAPPAPKRKTVGLGAW